MRAVIIDDDKQFCLILKAKLLEFGRAVGLRLDLTVAESVNELLLQDTIYDIYFIDIEMPEMNGLELVKRLRRKYVVRDFVFISFYDKYMQPAFYVRPTAFVRKGRLAEDLLETLIFIREKREKSGNAVLLKDNKKDLEIHPYQIMYCQSLGHYVKFYLAAKEPFLIRNKLSTVGGTLEEYDFIRVHSRYLVNLNFAEDFLKSKSKIVMRDGKHIPLSDTYREHVLVLIMRWFAKRQADQGQRARHVQREFLKE